MNIKHKYFTYLKKKKKQLDISDNGLVWIVETSRCLYF